MIAVLYRKNFLQIVTLYESTVGYVDPCLNLNIEAKAPKPYGLWATKKTTSIKFQSDPIFACADDEDTEDGDVTFAAKSTGGEIAHLTKVTCLFKLVTKRKKKCRRRFFAHTVFRFIFQNVIKHRFS